jgi:heme-degrading monooxygenase HmoA
VIIRVFRPTIHPGKEHEFETFLGDTAVPLVSQQAGLVAQHVGRPRDRSSTEYVYVTVWEDVESIRAFAGERWQEADAKLSQTHTYCRQAHRRSLPSRSTSTNSSTS